METFLVIALAVICIMLVVVVLLQSGRTAGLGAVAGGAEQLFGKKKARGVDLILHRVTVGLGALFFVITLMLAYYGI